MDVVGNRVILAFNEPGKNAFDQDMDIGKLDYDKEVNKVQAEIDDIKIFISMILNLEIKKTGEKKNGKRSYRRYQQLKRGNKSVYTGRMRRSR